ncbi:nucleotide exchange factor GrpE [Taibaiella sp. KBW10]|uniref:nucleotide exchange factor GrpE n=1 Tax=Taibaiella sp. KBW10 TaxID=2153357 RepID=UPI000F5B7D79|nr:nucleotide exchange factor GrpE [Taibaiella sp. KBW10]RQO31096.1 nucleotide exchange factor GrpE [Taibaiella sp. KBW10]
METMDQNGNQEQDLNKEALDNTNDGTTSPSETAQTGSDELSELEKVKAELAEMKDKYLRQVAEFDNFRKRNAKERLELMQTAGKDVIVELLDVLDDSDRALQQMEQSDDLTQIKSGTALVLNKLKRILEAKGLKAMETKGADFDVEFHEAITEIPAPNADMQGKVIDELQKGYYLNDKIIRHAKVVVGK